ncbi:hypothetical protein D9757_009369 [Collybiopsis confluens]|uniref:Terpene synthase n=1 Tax=Collybiopsis confluens TaxID=2823264 RepID=A0A8H5H6L2_9AGAR|nr:hypothetical protein D9757_009369 [Collybiopsis confluens]
MELSFVLPDLAATCPFPLQINRYYRTVPAETKKWILESAAELTKSTPRFIEQFDAQKYHLLASACYPDADHSGLRFSSDYLSYIFYFDEVTDQMNEVGTSSVREEVLNSIKYPDAFKSQYAVGKLIADLFRRMRQNSSPGIQRRFIETMESFCKDVDREARHRISGHVLDPDVFLAHRRETNGCKTCWVLIEYANGLRIPDEVLYDPHIKKMETVANDFVTYVNDLYSYNIEQSKGQIHNIITSLMHANQGMDIAAAVGCVNDLVQRTVDDFLELKVSLPSWGAEIDADVAVYIRGLESWMAGLIFWSLETERYFEKSTRVLTFCLKHSSSRVHRPRDIRCPLCSETFKMVSAIAQHVESGACRSGVNRHTVTRVVQSLDLARPIAINRRIMGGPVPRTITYSATDRAFNGTAFECYLCHKTFNRLDALNNHLGSAAHDSKEFRCPKCRKEYTLISALVHHIESEACGIARFDSVRNQLQGLTDGFRRMLTI